MSTDAYRTAGEAPDEESERWDFRQPPEVPPTKEVHCKDCKFLKTRWAGNIEDYSKVAHMIDKSESTREYFCSLGPFAPSDPIHGLVRLMRDPRKANKNFDCPDFVSK